MFALVFIPLIALWTADNHAFLAKIDDAPWHYVGVQDRPAGPQPNGAEVVPLQVGEHSYILFKQAPSAEAAERAIAAHDQRLAATQARQLTERLDAH